MSEVEKAFSCTNCGKVTKESDYPKESHRVYEDLKNRGFCVICDKMPDEEERKEYGVAKRMATAMLIRRKETITRDIQRLEAERNAISDISPEDMALQSMQEERKRKEAEKTED